jgi:hypothetical protein
MGVPASVMLTGKKRPEAEEQPVEGGEVRNPMARSDDPQELLLQENALGNDGTRAPTSRESMAIVVKRRASRNEEGRHASGA